MCLCRQVSTAALCDAVMLEAASETDLKLRIASDPRAALRALMEADDRAFEEAVTRQRERKRQEERFMKGHASDEGD
jgi:hypothetical protein